MKDGKKTGVALIEVQPGKWGPVKYIVALDLTGKVTNLAVMSYVEQRGRPIATRRFLGQFVGKTGKNAITIGKDIDAVSGATISSRATAFAVKKVVVLYDTFFLAGAEEKKGE
jgi:Na+-translocating ferredoxin:NAD+ oxidoreductase RnfG subunit